MQMVFKKRGSEGTPRTNIDERWSLFDQIRMVMKVIYLDALENISKEKYPK